MKKFFRRRKRVSWTIFRSWIKLMI
jgi:hypothetical protein